MTAAIHAHQLTKKFNIPGISLRVRTSQKHEKMRLQSASDDPALTSLAVDHVSIIVNEGEVFCLVGPEGAGKSTFIRLLATTLAPDSGELHIFGHNVVRQPARVQRLINHLSFSAGFLKQLTPLENLVNSARMARISGNHAVKQVIELLDRLGFEHPAIHQPMESLSRPQQQRVFIAQALLSRPRLLLLDEPTRNIHPSTSLGLLHAIWDFQKEHGGTVLLAMRDLSEAGILCDRVAIMENGRITALDTPNYLQSQYQVETHQPGAAVIEI